MPIHSRFSVLILFLILNFQRVYAIEISEYNILKPNLPKFSCTSNCYSSAEEYIKSHATVENQTPGSTLEIGHHIYLTGKKSRISVLFIHGYTRDSSDFDDISKELANYGINSISITLPGHGSFTEGYHSIKHEAWRIAAQQFALLTSHLGDDLVVVGDSNGGLLSFWLGVSTDDKKKPPFIGVSFPKVSALVLTEPAFRVKGLIPTASCLASIFVADVDFIANQGQPISTNLGCQVSELGWEVLKNHKLTDGMKPSSNRPGELGMAPDTTRHIPEKSPIYDLTFPTLIAYSPSDEVVDSEATKTIIHSLRNNQNIKEIIVPDVKHGRAVLRYVMTEIQDSSQSPFLDFIDKIFNLREYRKYHSDYFKLQKEYKRQVQKLQEIKDDAVFMENFLAGSFETISFKDLQKLYQASFDQNISCAVLQAEDICRSKSVVETDRIEVGRANTTDKQPFFLHRTLDALIYLGQRSDIGSFSATSNLAEPEFMERRPMITPLQSDGVPIENGLQAFNFVQKMLSELKENSSFRSNLSVLIQSTTNFSDNFPESPESQQFKDMNEKYNKTKKP